MTRYFVTRTDGTVTAARSLAAAKTYANRLYDLGVVAPLVVAATDKDEARDKAARCYRGEITSREARR